MLTITIPAEEKWDEVKEELVLSKGCTITLEHSLISISKWESKWNKIFLSKNNKTLEETLSYIECMTITQNVDPDVYKHLSMSNIDDINAYINAPMTASTVAEKNNPERISREQITSELIYYWMINFNIPFECEKWHLNRLLMLVKICNVKNSSPKKMSKKDMYSRHAAINAANRRRFNSKG